MLTALVVIMVVTVSLGPVVALLWLTGWIQRARDEALSRQIAVTEAIHRELGAVVAPTVHKRLWGPWRVRIAVPFERPAVVCTVLSVAHRALALSEGASPGRFQIVLVPQGHR